MTCNTTAQQAKAYHHMTIDCEFDEETQSFRLVLSPPPDDPQLGVELARLLAGPHITFSDADWQWLVQHGDEVLTTGTVVIGG